MHIIIHAIKAEARPNNAGVGCGCPILQDAVVGSADVIGIALARPPAYQAGWWRNTALNCQGGVGAGHAAINVCHQYTVISDVGVAHIGQSQGGVHGSGDDIGILEPLISQGAASGQYAETDSFTDGSSHADRLAGDHWRANKRQHRIGAGHAPEGIGNQNLITGHVGFGNICQQEVRGGGTGHVAAIGQCHAILQPLISHRCRAAGSHHIGNRAAAIGHHVQWLARDGRRKVAHHNIADHHGLRG